MRKGNRIGVVVRALACYQCGLGSIHGFKKRIRSNCVILGRLPFVNKKRKFRLEIPMVQLIPPESFRKRWKSSNLFLFSRSNRNDRKIAFLFVNSHLARFTSAPFSAFHCGFFKMAASAAWQCTVCEAILQSTSEFLNHDCTGE